VGPSVTPFLPATMLVSPPGNPMPIFINGNLEQGTYKVQNLASQTHLKILEHLRQLYCRPATVLIPEGALVHVVSTYPWTFERRVQGTESKAACGHQIHLTLQNLAQPLRHTGPIDHPVWTDGLLHPVAMESVGHLAARF